METADAPRRVSAACDDALGSGDTTDLIAALRGGAVGPSEVLAAARGRLEAVNGAINAVAGPIDGVADAAPDPDGPFAGVPLPIKDNDDIAGHPTSWGSRALGPAPARSSSVFVRQLLALGFVPYVKTTLPEFGLTGTTQSTRFGDTRNPWDLARSTGGSSGGSAAVVAAGAAPIAHTNDGGGSTRIPASACGLVGLKPSRGRLIDRPELARVPVNLFAQGVVTRSVRDTALFYAGAERLYRNPGLPPVGHVRGPSAQRLRIAVHLDAPAGLPIDPQVVAAVEATGQLCASLGHQVDVVPNPFPDRPAKDFLRYWCLLGYLSKRAGGLLYGPDFDGSRTGVFTDGLAAMFSGLSAGVPGSVRRLQQLSAQGHPLLTRYDAVLSPTLARPPAPLEWLAPDVPFRTALLRLMRYVMTTPLDNVLGIPAISLPLQRTEEGLPMGMQFSAGMGEEALLLGLAYELEEAAPWPLTPGATA